MRVLLLAAPRLLTSSKAAVYSALVKSGGGGGRNCRVAGDAERDDLPPLRRHGGREGRRRRLPVARVGPRHVGDLVVRAVGAPPGQDLLGDGLPHGDALFRAAGRDAGEIGGQSGVERRLVRRGQRDQRVVRRLGGRGLERGPARRMDVGEERRVRPVDGVDGVVDRRVDDGRLAGEVQGQEAVVLEGIQEDLVPLEDDVRRQQAAVVQRFESRAEPGPTAGRAGPAVLGDGSQGSQDRAK